MSATARLALRLAVAATAMAALNGCVEPISDPWVSGEWGEELRSERTRTVEQQQALRGRLAGYADPYQ